jgi:hypothetical protein
LFTVILFSLYSSSEGKQGQNEKYQNSKIHYLNFNNGHVHENKQSLNGHQSLKHVIKLKKNKSKKVQTTIRIDIDFINNGKPFKVSSKRSKMLTEIKSNTKQLNSNKKEKHSPSHSPLSRRFGQQQQLIHNLKEHMRWKSMDHTNEIQRDFSGSKIKPRRAKLKRKIVILKAKDKAITDPMEQDMHTAFSRKPGIKQELNNKNESEESVKHIDENIVVSEQPCMSNLYEKEHQVPQSDKLKEKTINKLPTEKTTKETTESEADTEEENKTTTVSTLEEFNTKVENQLEKLDKEEEEESERSQDDKNAATIKGQSEMCEPITEQPVISELDRENPKQLSPGKPQFITRLTQITSKSQTSLDKPHSKDPLGMTTDIVQETVDHSTELRPILELRVINQIPVTVGPSDTINQEYQPSPHSYQGISTTNLIEETEDYLLADQYSHPCIQLFLLCTHIFTHTFPSKHSNHI